MSVLTIYEQDSHLILDFSGSVSPIPKKMAHYEHLWWVCIGPNQFKAVLIPFDLKLTDQIHKILKSVMALSEPQVEGRTPVIPDDYGREVYWFDGPLRHEGVLVGQRSYWSTKQSRQIIYWIVLGSTGAEEVLSCFIKE